MRREIGVAVIGTGFMGKAHALAYRAVPNAFPNSLRPRLVAVADVSEAGAQQAAEHFGFERATTDWRTLLDDPGVADHLNHDAMQSASGNGSGRHCRWEARSLREADCSVGRRRFRDDESC